MSKSSLRNAIKKNTAPKGVKSWLAKRLIPAASIARAAEKKTTVRFTAFAKTPMLPPHARKRLKSIAEPKNTPSSTHTSLPAKKGIVSANLSAARSII